MSEPVRPVLLEAPQANQKWTNPDGTSTFYAQTWHLKVFERVGGYEDDVARALGLGFTGLTQAGQLTQRVGTVEGQQAALQGQVAGLRGDPRLARAERADQQADLALATALSRAPADIERRLRDLERLVQLLSAASGEVRAQLALQRQANEEARADVTMRQAFEAQVTASRNQIVQQEISVINDSFDSVRNEFSADLPLTYNPALGKFGFQARTGWDAPTGTATRTTFDTTTVTTAQLAERVKALIDDLTTSLILES